MPPPVAAIFSLLLVLTGVAKLRRPEDTARALKALKIPAPRASTLALGSIEVVVGLVAILTSWGLIFAIQVVLYLIFLVWVVVALVRDVPIASCGCLGRDDTPPYWGHVGLDLIAVAASAVGAVTPTGSFGDPMQLASSLLVIVAGAWLGWAVLGDGARVAGLVRG